MALILRTRGGLCGHLTSVIRPPSGHLRQFRTKPQTKPQTKEETDALSKPVVEVEAGCLGPVGWSSLVRPTIFTLAFAGGTVSACAVWQYENMRHADLQSKVKDWGVKKAGGFREEMRQWWNKQHDAEKLFWPICFLNVVVYAAWKVPAFQGTMLKYFVSNPGAKAACLPMLLSAFAHFRLFHLGANMFLLHSFMSPAVELLGKEQFVAVYLSSAVFTCWASYVHNVATARVGFSLFGFGASGAIYTIMGTLVGTLVSTLVPDARMQILFLSMFTGLVAMKGLMFKRLMAMEIDHAAHLSGVLYGIFWCYFGHFGQKMVFEKSEPLVTEWHRLRSKKE